MKRGILIFLLMLFTYGFSFAQLTGIKNIPGDYPSLAAAVADLNVAGVGPGGVTFNISAGYTETFASATSGLITATGTASDPIVFQKAGIGANPVVTAPVGLGSYDYIICVAGGDYITIDGIDIRENITNTGSGLMEFGFAVLKTSPSNGTQYLMIRNSVITLGNNPGNWGIFSQNWDYLGMGSALTVTSTSGTNSYNKF